MTYAYYVLVPLNMCPVPLSSEIYSLVEPEPGHRLASYVMISNSNLFRMAFLLIIHHPHGPYVKNWLRSNYWTP